MTSTLIAFSGGLDSSWLLYKLLNGTDDSVRAFWIDYSNVKHLTVKGELQTYYHDLLSGERITAPKVIDWLCKNVRSVSFEVVKDVQPDPISAQLPQATSRGWRVAPMLRAAAQIVLRDGFDRFVYGYGPENQRSPGHEARFAWYKKWWAEELAPGTTFETPLIDDWEGRPHALTWIPTEMLELVLTCNDPKVNGQDVQVCHVCDKCILTEVAIQLLDSGMSANAALDLLLKKRKAGPYIGTTAGGDERFGANTIPSRFPEFGTAQTTSHPISREAFGIDKPRS